MGGQDELSERGEGVVVPGDLSTRVKILIITESMG